MCVCVLISQGTPIVDWDDPWRGVLAVPIVRLMYSATATRVLLFGLISTMHDVVGVFAQLLVRCSVWLEVSRPHTRTHLHVLLT